MIIGFCNTNKPQNFWGGDQRNIVSNQNSTVYRLSNQDSTVYRLSNVNNRIIKTFSKPDISIQYSERLINNNIESPKSSILNTLSEFSKIPNHIYKLLILLYEIPHR